MPQQKQETSILDKKFAQFRETYELTAQLLAGENISVVFTEGLKAPAQFDTVRRVLKINRLSEKQIHLTNGLVAHEVGHALFTNPTTKDLKDVPYISHLFNTIEDGFQERMYCKKFPGAKKHLYDLFAYFFKGEGKLVADESKLSKLVVILNTLNFNCKGMKHGDYKQYPDFVEDDDIILLMEAEMLSDTNFRVRWEFSRKLSAALRKYSENAQDQKEADGDSGQGSGDEEQEQEMQEGGGNGEGGNQPLLDDEEQDDKNKNDDDNQDSDGDSNSDDENDEDNSDADKDGKSGKGDDDAEGDSDSDGDADSDSDKDGEGKDGKGKEGDDDADGDSDSDSDGKEGEGKGKGKGKGKGEGDSDGDSDEESDSDSDKSGSAEKDAKGGSGNAPEKFTDQQLNDAMDELENEFNKHADDLNDHHKLMDLVDGNDVQYAAPDFQLLSDVAEFKDILEPQSKYAKDRIVQYEAEQPNEARQADVVWQQHFVKAKKAAQFIFGQFNIKKSAMNLNQTQYRKSGALDPTRLCQYQLTDDIFMNVEIVPNQTNHGYVVVLDWSGSMGGSLLGLTHRIMELTYFALLAEVEIEVWLYTTNDNSNRNQNPKPSSYDKVWEGSKFIKVLNSKRITEFEVNKRLKALWLASYYFQGRGWHSSGSNAFDGLSLGGTNILEGTVFGHGVLERIQAEKKTLFVLTDGQDSSSFDHVLQSNGGVSRSMYGVDDLQFHGTTISNLVRSIGAGSVAQNGIRPATTRALTDFYRTIGHQTICISWDCGHSGVRENEYKFGGTGSVLNVSTTNAPKDDYVEVDNIFIKQLVESLL